MTALGSSPLGGLRIGGNRREHIHAYRAHVDCLHEEGTR
jgi:hypothetical protein